MQSCQEISFCPWGRRDANNWRKLRTIFTLETDRGFSGHEHLDEFNLINMNRRLYDPLVGRFLSPDNYVQATDYSQSYNRYSYALNNPLIYTDPSGELSFLATLAIVWAGNYIIGWLDNVINKEMSPKDAFKNTSFVMGFNWAPADFKNKNLGVSHPQVDAHNLPGQITEGQQNVINELNQVRNEHGAEWMGAAYGIDFTAVQDATLILPQMVGTSPLSQQQSVFGVGDAITIYNEVAIERKKIPYIGTILTGLDVYDHLKKGNYPEAIWSIVGAAGGIYTVGFKSLAYGYNTKYMQTQLGQAYYRDYLYNLNMYRRTRNEKYLDKAIYYERLMRKSYNNIQKK